MCVAAVADGAPERSQRRVLVLGYERRGGPMRPRVVEVRDAAAERDEQVAGADAARVDLDARDPFTVAVEPAEPAERVEPKRDQVRAPSVRSASRAASRSSNGTVLFASS